MQKITLEELLVEYERLQLENYKLNGALDSVATQLEILQIILNNAVANEQGKDTCTIQFTSVEQLSLYLAGMNQALINSLIHYRNKPLDEIKRNIDQILSYAKSE